MNGLCARVGVCFVGRRWCGIQRRQILGRDTTAPPVGVIVLYCRALFSTNQCSQLTLAAITATPDNGNLNSTACFSLRATIIACLDV
ncbi:hypothetical protein ACB092_12G138800 [Castanea dentata]